MLPRVKNTRGTSMNTANLLTTIFRLANEKINSNIFREKYRIGKAFTRTRNLSFSNLIYFILQSTHKSISINYTQLLEKLSHEKLTFVSKQAISKARQGISPDAFKELFRISVEQFYKVPDILNNWNGFHIYAVDGSTIQIPESKENSIFFGSNPNKTAKESPLASISVLYDVLNDVLVDTSLYPYRYNERAAAKEHLQFLPKFQNTIILFDRGYPSEELFRFLDSRNIFFLMRLPKTYKKAIFEEKDFTFSYPDSDKKKHLTLRSIHFPLEDGKTEYLVTNIMQSKLEYSLFKELYSLRWGVESKYRELKNRLEIEAFNSIKPICIQQEFFAAMFISNLAAILKRSADSCISVSNTNKYLYKTNRSYILNRIKSYMVPLLITSLSECQRMILKIIEEASKVLSIIRPGRKFGRYRKHTRRRYYTHIKSCL